ncbi:hypothetical protein ABK040_014196 [Willaertia magna]
MKIYTKTGDKGSSSLYNSERRPKDDLVFGALGDVDELNAHLGLAREFAEQLKEKVKEDELNNSLITSLLDRFVFIQSRLLDAGSCIATPAQNTSSEDKLQRVKFNEEHILSLENWIDEMEEQLPPLKHFILPSGGLSASQLHICRTVCRRAERSVVHLVHEGKQEGLENVQKFLNRLSDYLFVASRLTSKIEGKTEVIWTK